MEGSKMTTLQFKCTLLSDIIINQKAATEGNQQTLDFIPGSNFLGIAAQNLYKDKENDKYDSELAEIFHSGKVRFGDAHPSMNGLRALMVPAVIASPKLQKNEYYIIPENPSKDIDELQLKQCRSGFYHFEDNKGIEIMVNKTFAIKSAYDRDSRRSKDEAMYGYQSIEEGTEMYFEIEFDADVSEYIVEKVKNSIIGQKRTGRSRTAQYGLVDIQEQSFRNVQTKEAENNIVSVYTDGRLIFIDNFGMPTFQPTEKQLGFHDVNAEIIWEKSQIRTFQYAPWNFKRQTRDADRCGIEKGSVFYVKSSDCPASSKYIGSYNNEGFGKVIYNPEFLKAETNHKAVFQLSKGDDKNLEAKDFHAIETPLIQFLKDQQAKEQLELQTIELVNDFVEKNTSDYQGKESFASQWGNIRKIAMQYKTKEEMMRELFTKTINKNGNVIPFAYLSHGVAKEKWDDRRRREKFQEFFNKLNDDNVEFAIINLAAEMAKICRRTKK